MAKQKTKVRFVEHPKQAPEGMEFVDVKRTIGEHAGAVIRVLVPVANGAGYAAGVKYLSAVLPANGPDGTVFAAEAFRSAWVDSVVTQGKTVEIAKVGTIVPRIAALRVVDKAAVAGDRLVAFITEHGRPPTADENKDIYAGLAL